MNRDYRVRVYDRNLKKASLVGVSGLISLCGVELAARLLKRAQNSKSDKITCRLRRGIVVSFYYR